MSKLEEYLLLRVQQQIEQREQTLDLLPEDSGIRAVKFECSVVILTMFHQLLLKITSLANSA